MEITQIDGESIKITLSAPDMKEMNINCDEMSYSDTKTRKILWQVLDTAKTETGFDAASGKIEVRVLTSKAGGCELFIRKRRFSSGGAQVSYIKENYRILPEKADGDEKIVFKFDSIDALSGACKQLAAKKYQGKSNVYFDSSENGYYLVIDNDTAPQTSRLLKSVSFLSEFGSKYDGICADAYIKEHCKCLCDGNAIKIIAESC